MSEADPPTGSRPHGVAASPAAARRPGAPWPGPIGLVLSLLLALTGLAAPAHAQGTCGAAGGPPAGPSATVCDYAREAAGLPVDAPATGAGNPIDLVTGNKYRHELDLRLDGPVPMAFARHYNSRNRHAGPLGVGWSHSLETRVARVRAAGRDTLQVVQGDGRRLVFERDGARPDRWRTHDPAHGVIVPGRAAAPYRWTWRWPGGRALQFDAAGRLAAIERDGLRMITLHHDAGGRLTAVHGIRIGTLDFEYAPHPQGDRLVRLDLPLLGVAVRWHYDGAGQLAAVEWPDGRIRRYRYDDPHDPLLLTAVIEEDTDPAAPPREVARYAYDAQGRAIATASGDGTPPIRVEHHPPERAGAPGRSTVTDAAGRVAHYRWTYDRTRHVARLLDASGSACDGCPPVPRRYRWDAAGRLSRVESPAGSVGIERDAAGRPIEVWHGRGRGGTREWLWRTVYRDADPASPWSALEQPSVAPGRVHRIEVERDALGRAVAVLERGFAPVPGRDGRAAWAAIERRFGLGHRLAADAVPSDRRPPSDGLTLLAWVDGPLPGPGDRIAIDASEQELTLRHPGGRRETLRYTRTLLREHVSPHGLHARMQHNVLADDWMGGPTLTGAFIGARQIDLEHAPFGELSAVTLIDFEQRRRVVVRPAREDPVAGFRALATWRGRPTAIDLPDGTRFSRGFDDFGRVAWIDEPGAPRQWARYDEADRLVEHRPGDGTVIRHRRDASGRLIESRRSGRGEDVLLGRYRWRGGFLEEAATDAVAIRYGWDRLGRLSWAEHVFRDAPGAPLRWTWHYDLASRIASEELPGGHVVHYAYAGREVVGIEVERAGGGRVAVDAAALREGPALRPTDPDPPGIVADPRPTFAGGRLVSAAGVRHLPDPHGRRAGKRAEDRSRAAQDLDFVHLDWRLRAERSSDGRLRHWLWADARPVAVIDGDRVLRVVTDARRAPVRATDLDGRVVWSARYDRAGEARVEPGATAALALRLPGQYHDAETGWHHNHWRTYDPQAGRYLERDPLGLQPDWRGRDDLTSYAGGDPVGAFDPWGLARLTWYALTTGSDGRPLGRTQGFDRARWSFMIEDILPVPLIGNGLSRPEPAGIDGLLFDPWGDFIGGAADAGTGPGNGLDAIAWRGTTGRQVFAAFAAHYGGALASPQRFVIEGFDDRRAGALALILSASPSQRAACVRSVLGALPGLDLGPAERRLPPGAALTDGPPRLLSCADLPRLPVTYRDDLERSRVERYQAAAELQESPSASIAESCTHNHGCRSRERIEVNGRAYWASYGRTQFTVTTFVAELSRLTAGSGGSEAATLRDAIGLDRPITLEGRPATGADALALARRRVEATYRAFKALRDEFGRGLDAARARAAWEGLPDARRVAFSAATGLGREGFIDMLGYVATGVGARTEEEGRHALAASAAATVAWLRPDGSGQSFDAWMVELFASREPYDHVSRAFLRDKLRQVLASPRLVGRFDNRAPPGTDAWTARQQAIETDLARRVAILHNAGRLDLATQPDLDRWLDANAETWIGRYVTQFISTDSRGNWETLRCASGLAAGTALQFARLEAMTERLSPRPGPSRRLLAR